MKFGKAFQDELKALPPAKREQARFNRRATTLLASIAMVGTGLYAGFAKSDQGIPASAPHVAVSVNYPGEGADQIIYEVEPNALENAQEKQELDDFIDNQGKAANGDLKFGQKVQVPVIDPSPKE